MAYDIRPAGAALQFMRYERVQPKGGMGLKILQGLGLVRAKRRVKRIDELACPFEFVLLQGGDVERGVEELSRLRTDCTLVVLGTPETAADTLARARMTSPDAWAAEWDQLDLDHWLAERLTKLREFGTELPRGPWPSAPRKTTDALTSVRGFQSSEDFFPEVVIALVPTTEPAQLALHLGYGDWNECPSPAVHAAVAHRWAEVYGAVPRAFAGDVVEYRIARPVNTREQAIELAIAQFAYCPDIVLQGTGTIEGLAAELLGARYWFFWWD